MKCIFIGSQLLGARCLKVLSEQDYQITGIVTFNPDEHELWGSEVADFANEYNIDCLSTKNINSRISIEWIKARKPQIIYVIGWRQIISNEILSLPEHKVLGIHFSLLPKFRGHAPVPWAIIANEKKTGLTMFYLADRADAGDIIAQKTTSILPDDDVGAIRDRLEDLAVRTIEEYGPKLADGYYPFGAKQDETQASYGAYRFPEHGKLDWSKTSLEIHNLIRAITKPYAGAFTRYLKNGVVGKRITIWSSELLPSTPKYYGTPGQIILVKKNGVVVKTEDHAILIKDIQIDGESERILSVNFLKSTKGMLV